MRDALRRVAHGDRARLARQAHDLANGRDRPQHVGDVREGDELRARTDERAQGVEVDAPDGVERADAERRAVREGELLPGDEVRMVLGARDHDLVARAHVGRSPCGGHDVERFGGAAREDHPVGIGDAQKARDRQTRLVVALGGAHRERVGAAMRVRAVALVEAGDRVEHGARLLARRRRVEVHELGASRQQREIPARRERGHRARRPTNTPPSSMRTSNVGSGSVAGGSTTAPVSQRKRAPCQAHSIVQPGPGTR